MAGRRLARALPLIVFGAMSLLAFAGPFLMWAVLRGGDRPDWPPDRDVEWWTVLGVLALFVALMIASLGLSFASLRALHRDAEARRR